MNDIKIQKNRNREAYSFANINLLGKCNARCFFCLGGDISELLDIHNQNNVHFSEWKNFEYFLHQCKEDSIQRLFLTGQNTDSFQYKYLDELIDYIQDQGFTLGFRTNGFLIERKWDLMMRFKDEKGFSIHTLDPKVQRKIMGVSFIPDWHRILSDVDNCRVSIVLNRHNASELYKLLDFLSKYNSIQYIQVRRISTDTRYEMFKEDINLYEEIYKDFDSRHKKFGEFYLAQQYLYKGKEVNFWRTVETAVNSLNYFTDGTVSDNYFVVEGYVENYRKEIDHGLLQLPLQGVPQGDQ